MPPEPLFSVVIPTRNRPELALAAVNSTLRQTFDDYEILVLENSDEGRRLVDLPADSRIRTVSSDRILPMPQNWERLLDHAAGRYVIVVSDKDRLVPSALARLRDALALGAAVATFRKAWFQGGMLSDLHPPAAARSYSAATKPLLDQWFHLLYSLDAPMLYNSAVSRDLLLSLRARGGQLFYGSAPDVCSSVLILASCDEYRAVPRPLVVSHYGAWSNGIQTVVTGRSSFVSEFAVDPFKELGLVFSTPGVIAETLYRLKRVFPTLLADREIDWASYLELTARELLYSRESIGVDTSEDWNRLLGAAGRLYPRRVVIPALALRARRRAAQRLRIMLPTSGRSGRLIRRSLDRLGARKVATAHAQRAMSVEEAVSEMETLNQTLDGFSS
jgi:glycosyltransferase involved in cell wall biosynthesis